MTAGKLSKGCCNKHKKSLPRKMLSRHKSELWAAQNLSVCDLHSRGVSGTKSPWVQPHNTAPHTPQKPESTQGRMGWKWPIRK